MKRILLIITLSLMCFLSYANQRVQMDLREQSLSVEEVTENLTEFMNLQGNVKFILVDKETDDLGITHYRFQQFYNEIKVERAIIHIHAKDGRVQSLNGSVMDEEAVISLNRNAIVHDKSISYLKVIKNDTTEYRLVRREVQQMYEVYIDVETNEVLEKIPLYNNLNAQGSAKTLYNGWQNLTTYEENGVYYLLDETRHIATLNATGVKHPIYSEEGNPMIPEEKLEGVSSTEQAEEVIKEWIDDEFKSYVGKCVPYYNLSNTWDARLPMSSLYSLTINQILDNSWCGTLDTPDLYIKVYQGSSLVYKTRVVNDIPVFPYVYYFDIALLGSGYSLEIWDEDLDSDDCAATLSLDNIKSGIYQLKNKNISIELRLTPYSDDNMAFDAHWGMQKTYDYFRRKFSRKSYDNKGSIIYQLINPQKTFIMEVQDDFSTNNSFANSKFVSFMAYGIGDAKYYYPLVALDVMAHEFTHLVTANNRNGEEKGLIYQGESGALNESFSDIFATCVEFEVDAINADWTIGEDISITVPYLRNLSNPNLSYNEDKLVPAPDTYNGYYFVDTKDLQNDHGGVHTNSGVQNYWFYLLCEGGSGTNDIGNDYNVKGIGMDKAEQIAYRNLIYYLPTDATFEDARFGSIEACKDLYPNNPSYVESVINAWYAVGVGDKTITEISELEGNDNIKVENGIVISDEEFRIYDLLGRDVTKLNGQLEGVHIVKTEKGIFKLRIE